MVIVNIALLIWTGKIRTVLVSNAGASISFFRTAVPVTRLIAFFISFIVTGFLYLVMEKTKFGKAITAARMDLDAARLVGVNIPNTYAFTFGIGAALAGAAGSLLSMLGPISPNLGVLYAGKAFAICILGGQEAWSDHWLVPYYKLLETIGSIYLGAGLKDAIPFALLIIFLIIRPRGLFGKEYY